MSTVMLTRPGDVYNRERREVLYRVIQPLSAGGFLVRPVSRNDNKVAPLMDAMLCTCRGLFRCPMLEAELWPSTESVCRPLSNLR
jgi:hypothetical protein